MRKEKINKWIKIIITLVGLFFIVGMGVWFFSDPFFDELPASARNGAWSAAFLDSDHPRVATSMEELAAMSQMVVRVRVLDRNVEVFGNGHVEERRWRPLARGVGERPFAWDSYYTYSLYILAVYKGPEGMVAGNVIEIFQLAWRSRNSKIEEITDKNLYWHFCYIYADIQVGDELVVFLVEPATTRYANVIHVFESRNGNRIRRGPVTIGVLNNPFEGWAWQPPRRLYVLTNQVQGFFRYLGAGDFESGNPLNTIFNDFLFLDISR